MIEKLFGTTVTIVTLKSADSIPVIRNAVMGNNPGITFLEDSTSYKFPQKVTLVYNWPMLTCSMVKVEEEYTV